MPIGTRPLKSAPRTGNGLRKKEWRFATITPKAVDDERPNSSVSEEDPCRAPRRRTIRSRQACGYSSNPDATPQCPGEAGQSLPETCPRRASWSEAQRGRQGRMEGLRSLPGFVVVHPRLEARFMDAEWTSECRGNYEGAPEKTGSGGQNRRTEPRS